MCTVREYMCQRGCCILSYSGEDHNIFFLTKGIGVGEELLWDFLGWLDYGRLSFTKFCTQVSNTYKSTNPACCAFVSTKTFVDVFFCWVACFDFDYREEIDPFCGYDPEVLGCDGTHIGVSIKNLKLTDPITSPELEDHLPSLHTRLKRCFLPYGNKKDHKGVDYNKKKTNVREATAFLQEQVQIYLTGDVDVFSAITLSDLTEEERELELQKRAVDFQKGCGKLWEALEFGNVSCYREFLDMFLSRSAHSTVLKAAGKLLDLLLHHSSPVTTTLPYRFVTNPEFQSCCDAVESGTVTPEQWCYLELYSVELADLFLASLNHNKTGVVLKFVKALQEFIVGVHVGDRETEEASPIENSYDPSSGVAYYFTEHGNKVRETGTYDIKEKKEKREGKDSCQKFFPQISWGGFGYLFLFMCPYHGHCYGFHMINRGESSKDPFHALFKFKPSPPKEVFYDFACQFSEYSLNREPDFFKWVRFWHDLFHAVNHVCQPLYKSKRVTGLGGINSEICEQFNSYLKSIKFTGSSLSQGHFVHFLQFMILRWNRMKTEACEAKNRTSYQGTL
jgi:hypothetical protein